MRPLWLEYPEQSATWGLDSSFLLGSDILVHPVVTKDAKELSVFFPGKEPWYCVQTGAAYSGASGKPITVSFDV
jgi:alpha-glucosidase (family GH31 glycosyl hydrolase)